ncbi:DUF1156 domain-containing protein, partial [Rhodococcus rhodochrous]|uniref:DUF1156 domain-containing protein n=1 Tax=Rhodococcus rhodochrous TaxID=1829 RepID=UPI0018E16A2A
MTADTAVPRRKLIEVALPLTTINAALKAEKDRKVGKPQNNHHWWSRKPITAARVILFSQLVDDPSAHPEKFPTELDVLAERRRLHQIVEKLSEWESYRDIDLLKAAREEILASSNGEVPTIIDPFSGGGSIPLEAQRLGLHTEASDINPVAVLISKALIEIPPKFRNQPP